jgi:hypothetical protein
MPKVFATARCARPWFGWTRTTWPTALRGNQIQAPRAVDATSSPELHLPDFHAIDAMLSPEQRLLDGARGGSRRSRRNRIS